MLNIFKTKLNKHVSIYSKSIGEFENKLNYYPTASKEWFNSIYAYNKNTTKLLITANKTTLRLLKSYFNLYSKKLEMKIKSLKLRIRFRKISTSNILVSKAELKHTNDKVTITAYIYNRQKIYYKEKIKKSIVINNLRFLNRKFKIKTLIRNSLNTYNQLIIEKNIFLEIHKQNKNKYINYDNLYWNDLIYKGLLKEIYNFQLNKLIYINKCKFQNSYLIPFANLVKNVYNKNVVFNLVSLKYLYLNSFLLTQTLVYKIRKYRKNRLMRVIKSALNMFALPRINKLQIFDDKLSRSISIQNLIFNNINLNNSYDKNHILEPKDNLNVILHKIYPFNLSDIAHSNLDALENNKIISNRVLDSIKHKSITGVRIQAAGRLTRRYTASRSVSKVRYNGNLRNIASSLRGYSSVMFRGYSKSNLQYTKLKSNIRIGSFGIKGWVSSN